MKPIRIIVAGASGRMGQTIIKKIINILLKQKITSKFDVIYRIEFEI